MNNVASRNNHLGLRGASGCGLSLGVLGQSLQICDALGDALLLLEDTDISGRSHSRHVRKGKIKSFTVENQFIEPSRHNSSVRINRAPAGNHQPAGE